MGHPFKVAVWGAWCAVAILGTSACERTRIPDGGLTGEQLEVSASRLLRSGTLEWVIVSPEGTATERYALVSHAGQTHLFEVTPREGSQVARVSPIGEVPSQWVREVSQSEDAKVSFVTLEELMANPPTLSASVGVTTFAESKTGEVIWFGEPPMVATNVMLVSKGSGQLVDRLVESMEWSPEQGLIFDAGRTFEDSLVLPDGALVPELGDYIVGVVGGKASSAPGFEYRAVSLDGELLKLEDRRIRQRALDLGVDAITWKDKEGFHVLGLDLYDERVTSGQGIVPGPLGVVMTFADQTGVFKGLAALDALRRGHALRAAHALRDVRFNVAGSTLAGTLRGEELLGGAGRSQWMYQAKIQGREKLQGPEYIYLARAALLSNAPHDALVFAERAREAFWKWGAAGRDVGIGRASKLMGLAHLRMGSNEAFKNFEQSVKFYKQAGDEISAAEVEMLISDAARRLSMRERALVEGKRSRSRYYHGNDVFACGQAELDLVDIYLEYDLKEEAAATARYGFLRMQELGSEVGTNRAQIMEALSQHEVQPGTVKVQQLRDYYERARAQRDAWGEIAAASTLVLLGGDLESEELQRFGVMLVRGRDQYATQMLGSRIDRALASACAQGFRVEGDASISALCQQVMDGYAPEGGLIKGWIARGYGNILRGLDEEVAESSTRLATLLTPEFIEKEPALAAQIQLYLSAAASDEKQRESYKSEGVVNLRKIDVSQRALTMYALAMELEQRGQSQFKLPLLDDAVKSAHAQGQRALSVRAGVAHVEALRQAGKLEEALRAQQLAAGRLTDEDARYKAHLAMERALIGEMRGTASSSKSDWAVAFDAVDKLDTIDALEVLLHGLEVSLSDAKGVQAAQMRSRIESLEKGMTPALVASLEGKRVLAHSELLRAERLEDEGKMKDALELAASASSTLADDPEPRAVWVRSRALAMLARHAYSVAQTEETEQRLEELWARQTEALDSGRFRAEEFRAPVSVARALSEIRYLRGDADAALAVFGELMLAGLSPTSDMASVACERGRLLVVSGELQRGRAELERCIDLKPRGEIAYQAKMMRALLEESPDERRRAMVRMLDSREKRERARRDMLLEMSEPDTLTRAQSALQKKQYKRYSSSKGGEQQAKEGAALVEMLLDHGKIEEARGVLEELKPLLYELGEEYPVDYVRLNTDVKLHELAALDAQFYLERASVELPQGLEPARQAALDVLRARLALALGQWTRARVLLSEASALAKESGESALRDRIDALAATFELQI